VAGADGNASFEIVGNELCSNSVFESRTKSSYTIRVRTTDSGNLLTEQSFTIMVASVNQPTATIVLSKARLADLLPDDTFVGTLSSSDPDGPGTTTCSPPALDTDDLAWNDRFLEDARGLSECLFGIGLAATRPAVRGHGTRRRTVQQRNAGSFTGSPVHRHHTTHPDVARPLDARMRIGTLRHHRPDSIDGNQGTVFLIQHSRESVELSKSVLASDIRQPDGHDTIGLKPRVCLPKTT
jgi:hypothetical protein